MTGKWLPADRNVVVNWAKSKLAELKLARAQQYAALKRYFPDTDNEEEMVQEFVRNVNKIEEIAKVVQLLKPVKELVYAMMTEPEVGMVMVEMFRQDGTPMNVVDFIFLLNGILRQPPKCIEDAGESIPCPIGGLLTYVMATPAGFAAFIKSKINKLFKHILNDYGTYLQTKDSAKTLDDKRWFEPIKVFENTFICKPSDKHLGYESFDAFFTRELKPEARPIADPSNPYVIANACENAPYRIRYTVNQHDAFWIKTQPYSLEYILQAAQKNEKTYAEKFYQGTIYQGFLSPHTYHRFHAPVSGKVVRADVVQGTYFSQPYYTDEKSNYIASQPYLAQVATRGVIVIDTDTKLGLVAFVPIGMVEVSSVNLTVKVGQQVEKGDNIGFFRFGGSSHLVIFEKGKNLAFDLHGKRPDPFGSDFIEVRSRLATFVP